MVSSIRRPQSVALIVLALAGLLVWAGKGAASVPAQGSPVTLPMPDLIGDWAGTAIPVDNRTFEILETKDVTVKEYQKPGEGAVLFTRVGGFGSNRAAFHPPEICFVGSDFQIDERGAIPVTVGGSERKLMRLVIAQNQDRFEAWYWFTANGKITPSYYQQQWWLMKDLMSGKPMSGTLVRISTPMEEDPAVSRTRLTRFLADWEALGQAS